MAFPFSVVEHHFQSAARSGHTGVGVGDSGGCDASAVHAVRVDGGHFMAMLNPRATAQATARAVGDWLQGEMEVWRDARTRWREAWVVKDVGEKQGMSDELVDRVKKWDGEPVGIGKL